LLQIKQVLDEFAVMGKFFSYYVSTAVALWHSHSAMAVAELGGDGKEALHTIVHTGGNEEVSGEADSRKT